MNPFYILSLLMLTAACGNKLASSGLEMGKTTKAEAISKVGLPESEEDLPMPDSKIMNYADGSKIQLKGDIVVNLFRDPKKDQKLVLWWKHKFKDCVTTSRTLPQPPGSHTPPEIELSCPAEGVSIIYTEGAEFVGRVVEFEK